MFDPIRGKTVRVIRCPKCNKPLPAWAHYCTGCGEPLIPPGQELLASRGDGALTSQTIQSSSERPRALKVPHFFLMGADEPTEISATRQEDVSIQQIMEGLWEPPTPDGDSPASIHNGSPTPEPGDELEDTIEDAWHSRTNWHRDVLPKPPIIDDQRAGETPPGLMIPPSLPARRRMPSGILFWVSMLLLFGLVVGGLFGVVLALERGVFTHPPPEHVGPSLQITPSSIALGALISLHGSHFTPMGRVGLSYDASIPVFDTDGKHVILADQAGNFTDTAIVEPEWQAGPHTIHAEDALLHKIASFTVIVTGSSASLRPAHLQLSVDAVDFGSGDQATNSTQTVTLLNVGGGQVTWQTAATQPWLALSPSSGTFASNQSTQVVIAANRSKLTPGSYTAAVIFSSNAGQISLPVKMAVTLLQPGHGAVLQLTSAALSFSASDGGTNPPGQGVTISNPGIQPLHWSATSVISDAPHWLSLSPQSGSVAQGANQAVTIGVNVSDLLPGIYSGTVTFTSQGSEAVKGSPQSVYVSVTVLPQCTLLVSPGTLSFAAVHAQSSPAAKVANLSVIPGCSTPLHWSATTTDNGGHWLNINSTSGTTPASPSVSVNSVNLAAGTYTGAVTFTSGVGTQTVPVTLTVGQSAMPIMATTPTALFFGGVPGRSSPGTQTITLTNTGSSTMTWNATAATEVGGAWLAVAPTAGRLFAHQSTSLTVAARLLPSLISDTYNGAITIQGFDDAGNPAADSPQQIPVIFNVEAACTISVAPAALSFTGVADQSGQETQASIINANGACEHRLEWTASVVTSDGGSWLTTTPAAGWVSPTGGAVTHVGVVPTGLANNTYTGIVRITATDGVTHQPVGTPQTIMVTLIVQPICTLQAPSPTQLTFNAVAGSNPPSQVLTVGVSGNCGDGVTVTPTVTPASGTGWLTVTPARATIWEGRAIFHVIVNSAALAAASYTGSISLSTLDAGITIAGSPRTVGVTLNVLASPVFSVSSTHLLLHAMSGQTSMPQSVTVTNAGGSTLTWTLSVPSDASWLQVNPTSGSDAPGDSSTLTFIADASSLQAGTYTTHVTIRPSEGTPIEVVVTFRVSASSPTPVATAAARVVASPAMQISNTQLLLYAMNGKMSTPHFVTVTNTGGGTLTWTLSVPSDASWLQVNPTSGSEASGASSTLTFIADAGDLQAGTYTTQVTLTPSGGMPGEVFVTFRVSALSLTPVVTATATAVPVASPSMQISGTQLFLHAMVGKTSLPHFVTVTNTGGGTLTWTLSVTPDAPWLQVSSTSGIETSGESSTLTLIADAGDLQAGIYTAQVTIMSSGGTSQEVFVTFRVSA